MNFEDYNKIERYYDWEQLEKCIKLNNNLGYKVKSINIDIDNRFIVLYEVI